MNEYTGRAPDITGIKFGRLTVVSFSHKSQSKQYWDCKCECGNFIKVYRFSLISKDTRSCGCFRKERTIERSQTHGDTVERDETPEYRAWVGMKNRCNNPKTPGYKDYGARGIRVCKRWNKSFPAFLKDMGRKPPRTSLDRINNNGNYEPNNCRWATPTEQCNNRRTNKHPDFNPELHIMKPIKASPLSQLPLLSSRQVHTQ